MERRGDRAIPMGSCSDWLYIVPFFRESLSMLLRRRFYILYTFLQVRVANSFPTVTFEISDGLLGSPPPLSKVIDTYSIFPSVNIYTDGSKTTNGEAGAVFVVP